MLIAKVSKEESRKERAVAVAAGATIDEDTGEVIMALGGGGGGSGSRNVGGESDGVRLPWATSGGDGPSVPTTNEPPPPAPLVNAWGDLPQAERHNFTERIYADANAKKAAEQNASGARFTAKSAGSKQALAAAMAMAAAAPLPSPPARAVPTAAPPAEAVVAPDPSTLPVRRKAPVHSLLTTIAGLVLERSEDDRLLAALCKSRCSCLPVSYARCILMCVSKMIIAVTSSGSPGLVGGWCKPECE